MEEEKKDNREKIKEFLQDKGVYLVLLACMLVIGVAVAAAYLPKKEEPPKIASQVSESHDERLSAVASPSPSPTPAPVPDVTPAPSTEPAATPAPAREKANAPLKGRVQWGYAVDELIFSRTLNQWMTHRGIDISAAKGAEVHAVWAGKVKEVYEDESLGISVRVASSDGLEAVYSNLRAEPPVKKGGRINAGDIIGYVGDTAVAECGDGAHLHFEVYKDGKVKDPLEYVIIIEE